MHPKNHIKFGSPLIPNKSQEEFQFSVLVQGYFSTIPSQAVIRDSSFFFVAFSMPEYLLIFSNAPQKPHSEKGVLFFYLASSKNSTMLHSFALRTFTKVVYFDLL